VRGRTQFVVPGPFLGLLGALLVLDAPDLADGIGVEMAWHGQHGASLGG
jgi:hypothetical protein